MLRTKEKRNPQATREALLRAGAEQFAEAGYDGVKVEALARRAGVNKAMINYHFGGKRKLYVAVIRSALEDLTAQVEALQRSERPAPELLSEFIAGFAALAATRRPSFPALVIREALAAGELSREVLPLMMGVFLGVREVIERGVREGDFRPVDPTVAYMNLIGGLAFFFATEPTRRRAFQALHVPFEAPPADSYVEYVQDLMARGLAPLSAKPAVEGAQS